MFFMRSATAASIIFCSVGSGGRFSTSRISCTDSAFRSPIGINITLPPLEVNSLFVASSTRVITLVYFRPDWYSADAFSVASCTA